MERITTDLINIVAKVDAFGDDESDEFTVTNIDGQKIGIFKTWSVPAVPFLENGKTGELINHLEQKKGDFFQSLEPDSQEILMNWCDKLSEHPARLWQTLEKWRGFSEVFDRRLNKIYQERELPEPKTERVAELYWRLRTAFGYAAPFYHLEAMVADNFSTPFNPIKYQREDHEGGSLDVVGMLLPSALSNLVVAEKLNWNDLNWNQINENTKDISNETEKKIAFRLARKLGVGIEDVVFAANLLEWIPSDVGGKKGDVSPEIASELILESLENEEPNSHTGISRNFNALIRFLNWFPLEKSDLNFSTVEDLRYSSVCDTANCLLDEVAKTKAFKDDFHDIFRDHFLPQIQNVDATSARGRFLMQVIENDCLKPEFMSAINEKKESFISQVSSKLKAAREEESVCNIFDPLPRFRVGGKVSGLREAAMIFGPDSVLEGEVVTSEAVENWLMSEPELWNLILKLDQERDPEKKIELASVVESKLLPLELPEFIIDRIKLKFNEGDLLAVRSSSFDEDTMHNGSAVGIIRSEITVPLEQVGSAIKSVVSSFLSEKAVSYRYLHGLSDIPMMSVGIHRFIQGRGGVAFSAGDGLGWKVVVGESPSEVVEKGDNGFDTFELTSEGLNKKGNHNWIDEKIIMDIGSKVVEAEQLMGGRSDVEFVVDQNGKLVILQLRSLCAKKEEVTQKEDNSEVQIVEIQSLDDLDSLQNQDKRSKLRLGEDIDIDQFQGKLFRWLVKNKNGISEVALPQPIPTTSHFANICINLGIKMSFENE